MKTLPEEKRKSLENMNTILEEISFQGNAIFSGFLNIQDLRNAIPALEKGQVWDLQHPAQKFLACNVPGMILKQLGFPEPSHLFDQLVEAVLLDLDELPFDTSERTS